MIISNVTIKGIVFINSNPIEGNGAAILFDGYSQNITIDATFENNTGSNGGAIFFNSANNVNISGTFVNNNAIKGGGVCFNLASDYVNINGNFFNNSASGRVVLQFILILFIMLM